MSALFVYGSLQVPAIVKALTGKRFARREATLPGYRLYSVIKDGKRSYPAILPASHKQVSGEILIGTDQASMEIIDFFKGATYTRRLVDVMIEGDEDYAYTYLRDGPADCLEEGRDLSAWKEDYLEDYLEVRLPRVVEDYYKSGK